MAVAEGRCVRRSDDKGDPEGFSQTERSRRPRRLCGPMGARRRGRSYRSLKVLEWKDEVSAKSEDDLRQFISQLRQVTETETDDIRKEQARVRLALAELEALSRTPARRIPRNRGVKDVRDQSPAPIDLDQSALRQRLQEINRCINVARSESSLS